MDFPLCAGHRKLWGILGSLGVSGKIISRKNRHTVTVLIFEEVIWSELALKRRC